MNQKKNTFSILRVLLLLIHIAAAAEVVRTYHGIYKLATMFKGGEPLEVILRAALLFTVVVVSAYYSILKTQETSSGE